MKLQYSVIRFLKKINLVKFWNPNTKLETFWILNIISDGLKKMQPREAGLETKWNPLVTGQFETRIDLKRKWIVMDQIWDDIWKSNKHFLNINI